ncbi:thioredoxin domain protein [Natrialba magadii ATCC 43099]|uniref:Alkyl hydroperoxide reductase/ thiol specific antioxidant/ Mal allergen n=1 Tax=Natrialba magadii (strain ATCC 43099 / DSM 3394 / CCM 3739 / CIP 104546 / IAM 13178 / JCM 8861 / NBRC 102185 / NCIMB 2190 / MS3) TaxID=547559 RepID=D3SY51_NATMM|nr:TlpA disulfide reductase family protein [Natrialba magadii]ADD06022.1 thioredoxin domain protein [Natrialba magadii ATCC 43099]ELY30469.1 alkyl hydroperoxide reductase/ thiol specific antioxidant/ Mal allergen [Natrialba magadii ATCC 43099]
MRRRDLIAGVGSLGVLAGAGGVLWRGIPVGDEPPAADAGGDEDTEDDDSDGPIVLETIDATGSEEGTIEVPNDGVTVVMFFSPSCGSCQALMPNLREASDQLNEEYGDDVTIVSVTSNRSEDELREWWDEHDGNWYLGHDPGRTLGVTYQVVGYPVIIVIDENGEKHWDENGVINPRQIYYGAAPVIDEYRERTEAADDADDAEEEPSGTDSEGEESDDEGSDEEGSDSEGSDGEDSEGEATDEDDESGDSAENEENEDVEEAETDD